MMAFFSRFQALFPALLVLLIAILLWVSPGRILFEFRALNGQLDLSWWLPEEDGPAELRGVWQMMPHDEWDAALPLREQGWRLANLPGDSGLGLSARTGPGGIYERFVYRLTVSLASARDDLAIFVKEEQAAFHIYVDGKFVAGSGWPGGLHVWPDDLGPGDNVFLDTGLFPIYAPLGPLEKQFDVIIIASSLPELEGHLQNPVLLGSADQLKAMHVRYLAEQVLLTGMVIMFTLLFVTWFILRPSMQQFLFLAVAGLLGGLWIIFNGYLPGRFFSGFSIIWINKVNALLLVAIVPVYYGFYWRSYPQEFIGQIFVACLLWTGIGFVSILTVDDAELRYSSRYLLVPVLIVAIVVASGLVQAWRAGRYAAPWAFVGACFILVLAMVTLFVDRILLPGPVGEGWIIMALLLVHALMAMRGYNQQHEQVLAHNAGLRGNFVRLQHDARKSADILREREDRISRMTARDRETGLASREGLLPRLAVECARALSFKRDLCLAVIDIGCQRRDPGESYWRQDRLDASVIPLLAEKIWSFARETDVVAHLGEARFALILIETNAEETQQFLAQLPEQILNLLPDMNDLYIRKAGMAMPDDCVQDRDSVEAWLNQVETRLEKAAGIKRPAPNDAGSS